MNAMQKKKEQVSVSEKAEETETENKKSSYTVEDFIEKLLKSHNFTLTLNDANEKETPIRKKDQKVNRGETPEQRAKRRDKQLNAITAKFNFSDLQMGVDKKGNKISPEKVKQLFKKCFGTGNPGSNIKPYLDYMCAMLIDKRNQCKMLPEEGYNRQTVLNVLGYFLKKNILVGKPDEIINIVFSDAKGGICRNLLRGLDNLRKGTAEALDFYIDKVLNGEPLM